jgi:hypothetical protein
MAERNHVEFLGSVPIDTVLVGLLDAVSKGEIQGAAISDDAGSKEGQVEVSFPLLDRYNDTTSSRVWKEITEKIVQGVEKRRTDFASSLAGLSI